MNNINKLILTSFLGNLYFFLPVLTLFLLDNEIGLAAIVFSQVVYSASSFIAEIPTGVLADRFGHKKSYALGRFSDAVGLLLIVLFPVQGILYFGQFFRGLSGALMSGSEEALLYEYSREAKSNYTKQISKQKAYGTLGFSLSALIAGVAVHFHGENAYSGMILLTVVSIIISVAVAIGLPEYRQNNIGKDKLFEIKQGIKLLKSNKVLMSLVVVSGVTFLGKYTLIDIYPPYFEEKMVEPIFVGLALSIGGALNFLMLKQSYKIEEKIGSIASITGTVAITALLYILFGVLSNPWLIVVTFVFLFSVMESKAVFVSSFANEHAPSSIRATVLSTVSQFKELIKIIVKSIFAIALGVITLGELFVFYGVVLVLGALVGYLALKKADKAHNAT
jgi:MFS family permease